MQIIVSPGDNLQTALDDASSGDTIRVKAGTYTGKTILFDQSPETDEACFAIRKSLTIEAYGDGRPILTYNPIDPPYWWDGSFGPVVGVPSLIDNVTVRGCEIVGMNAILDTIPADERLLRTKGYGVFMMSAGRGGADFLFEDLIIHDSVLGIGAEGDNGIIRFNRIYDCGVAFLDSRVHGIYVQGNGIEIAYNHTYRCAGYGIHIYGSNAINMKVHHNIVTGNGYGMLVTGSTNKVVSNTVSFNRGIPGLIPNSGDRAGLIGSAPNALVANNLLWANGLPNPDGINGRNFGDLNWGQILETELRASCTFRSNCYDTVAWSYGPDYHFPQESFDPSDVRIDPLLHGSDPTDVTSFHLERGSPASVSGTAQDAAFNQAIDPTSTSWPPALITQPAQWSIGAFGAAAQLSAGVSGQASLSGKISF